MAKVLISSSKAIQYLLSPATKTDDVIFRLHYLWTTRVLVVFAGFVLVVSSLGDSMVCYSSAKALPAAMIKLYCWLSNTNLLTTGIRGEPGTDVAHPGVLKYTPGDAQVYQRYYMWVPLVLLMQALTFYLAHYLWNTWEDKQVGDLVIGLDRCIPIKRSDGIDSPAEDKEVERRKYLVAKQVADAWGTRNELYVRYVVCQFLALVNAVGQIFFLDYFFGGQFATYGVRSLEFASRNDHQNRTDPAIQLFPRMTKCAYHQFGFAGSIEKYDILCALPYNVYYEKMFVFCWFWYVALSCLSVLSVAWWLLMAASSPVRRIVMLGFSGHGLVSQLLLPSDYSDLGLQKDDKDVSDFVFKKSNVGDWFFLHLLLANIDGHHHNDIFRELRDKLLKKGQDSR